MLRTLSRHAKSISIVGGFIFGTIGAIWSFAVDERLGEEMRQLSDAKADLSGQIRSLNAIASEYFIANQQGDLIFITATQNQSRPELANLIYKGNLLDRAAPVRNMIGALAVAKELDYRQTYDRYVKLNDEARAEFSMENFLKLKDAEREIISKGQSRIPILANTVFGIEKAISENTKVEGRNRVVGLLASFAGNFLLLLATLVASRQKDG